MLRFEPDPGLVKIILYTKKVKKSKCTKMDINTNNIDGENSILLPFADDFHIHLRQGIFCDSLVKEIKKGGVNNPMINNVNN